MRMFKEGFKWFVSVLAIMAIPTVSALADPPTATPKTSPPWPSNVPPVPRGIPDLIPYWNFDPPKSSLFDINKLTLSGDLRVRPEFRTNGLFGLAKQNDFFVQQWMRLGFNYAVAPDVDVFLQPQYAKNWGANTAVGGACGAAICANDPFHINAGDSFFVRQAYVIIRNLGVQNLDFKLGRQLLVFGNHRLFGHFDWANTGFSHDGISFNYAPSKMWSVTGGWMRPGEADFSASPAPDSFGLAVPGVDGGTDGTDASEDADFLFLRGALTPMQGLSIEPMWVFFWNGGVSGAAGGLGSQLQAHAPNQNRHTIGARAAWKGGAGGLKLDLTAEGYHQFGSIATATGGFAGNTTRDLHINAWAAAIAGGVTLANMPMSPRIGLEFNGASGDGDANCTSATTCNGNANTFENLYPTNHILMGYMDLFAWKNMIGYSGNIKLKPTPASHLEVAGWIFRRQTNGDNWYRAAQNIYLAHVPGVTTSDSLGQEIDIIYTHFIKQGKVALQVGYGHFFPGKFVEQLSSGTAAATGPGSDPPGQDWGYAQVHVNF